MGETLGSVALCSPRYLRNSRKQQSYGIELESHLFDTRALFGALGEVVFIRRSKAVNGNISEINLAEIGSGRQGAVKGHICRKDKCVTGGTDHV